MLIIQNKSQVVKKRVSEKVPHGLFGIGRKIAANVADAVVDDEKQIKRISGERQRIKREIEQKKIAFSLDQMSSLIKEGSVKSLPIIIKAAVD